jgi:hypothetical protein
MSEFKDITFDFFPGIFFFLNKLDISYFPWNWFSVCFLGDGINDVIGNYGGC